MASIELRVYNPSEICKDNVTIVCGKGEITRMSADEKRNFDINIERKLNVAWLNFKVQNKLRIPIAERTIRIISLEFFHVNCDYYVYLQVTELSTV